MITDQDIKKLKTIFPTKEDLKQVLSKYSTKDDLKQTLSNYPTKEDLKESLKAYATKDDLLEFKDAIIKEIRDLRDETDITATYRNSISDHDSRITALEKQVFGN